ncbi:hypothetical protein D3C71_1750490 [compost metagenome]
MIVKTRYIFFIFIVLLNYKVNFKLKSKERDVGVEKEYIPCDPFDEPNELTSGSPPVKCGA